VAWGDEVLVTDVPRVVADGLEWAHVQREWRGDGDGSGALGFVALGDASGPFLEAVDPDCPATASVETLAAMTPWARVVCFGSEALTLTAFDDPENYGFGGLCNCVAEPAWLSHPFAFRVLSPSPERPRPWLFVRLAPGVDEQWPDVPGESLRVKGHFDDPAAVDCEYRMPDPELGTDMAPWVEDEAVSVLRCREQFVVTEVEVISEG
jgi:hypothetical protein